MPFINWFILALLAAALIPGIISTIVGVDTSGWPAVGITIWDNLSIFIIIGVMILILRQVGLFGGGGWGGWGGSGSSSTSTRTSYRNRR